MSPTWLVTVATLSLGTVALMMTACSLDRHLAEKEGSYAYDNSTYIHGLHRRLRPAQYAPFLLGSGAAVKQLPIRGLLYKHLIYILPVSMIAIITLMMPQGGRRHQGPGPDLREGGSLTYRVPPAWSPENENHYSFRAYMTDLAFWIILTDLHPHQQAAAIITRLGGSARELARMITPQELIHGGVTSNGQQVDPVTYLLTSLHERYAQLEEESRLTVMNDMINFQRNPGESINSLLTRYETVRMRAAVEGQFVMSIEGNALQLLRVCGVSPTQMTMFLQPFNGQMPQNPAQFHQLCTALRRFGHITENAPGNIASGLRGNQPSRPGTYFGEEEQEQQQPQTFFGNDSNAPPATTPGGRPLSESSGNQASQGAWGQDVDWNATNVGGGPMSEPHTTQAFPVVDNGDVTETDTDTSDEDEDDFVGAPDVSRMSEEQAHETLYWAYKRAKKQWRRFTGKPVRKFRRFIKRSFKGKGKGRRYMYTQDDVVALLAQKGKRRKRQVYGKRFRPNRQKPKGPKRKRLALPHLPKHRPLPGQVPPEPEWRQRRR